VKSPRGRRWHRRLLPRKMPAGRAAAVSPGPLLPGGPARR
jgi:hypothetical protein